MKLQFTPLMLVWLPLTSIADDTKAASEQAALLYKPYIDCVAEKAYRYSSGPDAASDIAIAALQACEKLEESTYNNSISNAKSINSPVEDEALLTIPTLDRLREYVAQTAKKVAISVVVRNRAK